MSYHKILKATIPLSLLLITLSGCGGGNDKESTPPTPTPVVTDPITINGVAQLKGYIQNASVELFKISDLTAPIAKTQTSSSLDASAGSFAFTQVELSNDQFYLIKVQGGSEVYLNDNGEVSADNQAEVKGSIYGLAKGEHLTSNTVNINVITDMLYRKLEAGLSPLNAEQLTSELTANAQNYLFDLNQDGEVNNLDALLFNPYVNSAKSKISYQDISAIYMPKILAGASEQNTLSALLYLDSPEILIENGAMQKTPFSLKASLKNIPQGMTVKWLLNNVEKPLIDESITQDGYYQVVAQLYQGDQQIKALSTQVVAITETEVAKIVVDDITKDNEIVVTDEADSSLAGTQITIPAGALAESTEISVKKASVNLIPRQNSGTALSDVIVMNPSGLTFEKPVQIRIPYDETVNVPSENIRIIRYSDNGKIDTIKPLFVDQDTHEIVFETDHFTKFQADDDRLNVALGMIKTRDEKFVDKLNATFNYNKDIDEWEPILNTYIDQSLKKITLYDYLSAYFVNKQIYDIYYADPQPQKWGAEMLNALYPNANEMARNFQLWEEASEGIGLVETTLSAGTALASGKVFTALLSSLGVPTGVTDLTWYSPIEIGTSIIKSFNDSLNHKIVSQVIGESFTSNQTDFALKCTLEDNEYGDYINEMAEKQGIKSLTQQVCIRYHAYKANQDKQAQNEGIDNFALAKQAIEEAIAFVQNVEEIEKAKKNPTARFKSYRQSNNPLLIEIGSNNKLSSSMIEMELTGYYEQYLSLNGLKVEILDSQGNSVAKQQSQSTYSFNCKLDDNDNQVKRTCSGRLDIDLTAIELARGTDYILSLYKDNLFRDTQIDKMYFRLFQRPEPKKITISGYRINDNLASDGDYQFSITPEFDDNSSYPAYITCQSSDWSYARNCKSKITFSTQGDSWQQLKSVSLTIKPSSELNDNIYIDTYTAELDIKDRIAALKAANAPPPSDPALTIKAINGVDVAENQQNDDIAIAPGDKVTFYFDAGSQLDFIVAKRFESSTDKEKIETVTSSNTYTYTYDKSGNYSPLFIIKLTNGKTVWIKAPKVTVNQPDNQKPVIKITTDSTATYQPGEKITLAADVTDDGNIKDSEWASDDKSLIITHSGSLTRAYIIAPESNRDREYRLTLKVVDDDNAESIESIIIKVAKKENVTKALAFISENYPDGCSNFNNENCGYPITDNTSSFTKTWTFKNIGNVALSNLSFNFRGADDAKGDIRTGRIGVDKTTVQPNQEFQISVDITIPDNMVNGNYRARWDILDNGDNISLNQTTATMYFVFVLNRGSNDNDAQITEVTASPSSNITAGQNVDFTVKLDSAPGLVTIQYGSGLEEKPMGSSEDGLTWTHTRTFDSAGAKTITVRAYDTSSQDNVIDTETINMTVAEETPPPDNGDSTYTPFTQQMITGKTFYNVFTGDSEAEAWTVTFDSFGRGKAQEGLHNTINSADVTFDYNINSQGYLIFSNFNIIDPEAFSDDDHNLDVIGLIANTSDSFKICWRNSLEELGTECNDENDYEFLYKTKAAAETALEEHSNPDNGDSTYTPFTQQMITGKTLYSVFTGDGGSEAEAWTITFDNSGRGKAEGGLHDSINSADVTFDYNINSQGYLIFSNFNIIDPDAFSDDDHNLDVIGLIANTSDSFKVCWRNSLDELGTECNGENDYGFLYKTKAAAETALEEHSNENKNDAQITEVTVSPSSNITVGDQVVFDVDLAHADQVERVTIQYGTGLLEHQMSSTSNGNTNWTHTRQFEGTGTKTVTVRAYDQVSGGQLLASRQLTLEVFSSDDQSLAAPSNLTATAGNAQVSLSWNAVDGADNYSICYAKESITTFDNCSAFDGGNLLLNIQGTRKTIANLTNGTQYYFRVTAVDANNQESAASSEVSATPIQPSAGEISHRGFIYSTVVSPNTGRTWLDRNLGASRVCQSYDDVQCYGDYYQWGRGTDGHEKKGSLTTTTQNADVTTANNRFVIGIGNNDWTTDDFEGNARNIAWSKITGDSVCPVGYRVPTSNEFQNEISNSGINSYSDAFNSFFKFAATGGRGGNDGLFNLGANDVLIWSNTVINQIHALSLNFIGDTALLGTNTRANAYPVRCIKGGIYDNDAQITEVTVSPSSNITVGDQVVFDVDLAHADQVERVTIQYGTGLLEHQMSSTSNGNTNWTHTRQFEGTGTKTVTVRAYDQVSGGQLLASRQLTLEVFSSDDQSLAAPSNLTATAGNAQVSLSWNAVDGADNYSICYAKESITTFDNCSAFDGGNLLLNIQGTRKTIANLTNGTQYYFRVTANNASNQESAASMEASATLVLSLPSVYAHYSFDNLNFPGEDSSGNGHHLNIARTDARLASIQDSNSDYGLVLTDHDIFETDVLSPLGKEFTILARIKLNDLPGSAPTRKEGKIIAYGSVFSWSYENPEAMMNVTYGYSLSEDDWEQDGLRFGTNVLNEDGTHGGFGSVRINLRDSKFHLVGVAVSGTGRYASNIVNGDIRISTEYSAPDMLNNNNNKIRIGGNFNGVMNDLVIYQKALSYEEIRANK